MKKKTSLWISGITTVAMLAVAVGSFAAWDKLKADSIDFTAQSSTPATLSVTTDGLGIAGINYGTTDKNTTLIPENAVATTGGNETSELVAGFKVNLTENKEAKIYLQKPAVDGPLSSDYTVTVTDYGADGATAGSVIGSYTSQDIGTGSSVEAAELTNGHQYKVSVKFSSSVDGTKYTTSQPVKTTIQCAAVANPTT